MSWKKLYKFVCSQCKKERQTFKEDVSNNKICSKCRRVQVPKDQMSIFDALRDVENPVINLNN